MPLNYREFARWIHGIRLYIACAIFLFTAESLWWAHSLYGGTILFPTKLEELYAWLALSLLVIAVAIGPVCSTWPAIPGKRLLYEARRLIGIGAAWFSSLHILIAYGLLFKFANPFILPASYQRAFALGAGASLILLAMAFTSFDRAFSRMGKWWHRLHRLVYAAIIFILLHALLIGTHKTALLPLLSLTISAVFIVGLHVYAAFFRGRPASVWQAITIPTVGVLLALTLGFGFNQKYDYLHHGSDTTHEQHSHAMEMK